MSQGASLHAFVHWNQRHVLRAGLTKFQWLLSGLILASVIVVLLCPAGFCLWVLGTLYSVSGLCIGLGVSFPEWQMFGESLCLLPSNDKRVALTFDDGPDPNNTALLLDLLARRGVPATFFGIGRRVARHPDLARRMVAEGHRLENHSHQHSLWTNLLSCARLRADVSQAQETIERVTGRRPTFFRPPMGLTNPQVFRVARALDLRVTGYSVRGLDRRRRSPGRIVARIWRRVRPGAIILLHDGGVPADRLLAVVSMLIDKLQALDYQCVQLDDSMNKKGS